MKCLKTLALCAVLAVPLTALANVQITEVMYDVPGSDAGHEWIEVTNKSTTTVDLRSYKLSEGGTNHALIFAKGTSALQVGEKAIITTDPQQYVVDHPTYVGTIFRSSFSLSNMGETIQLKDKSLQVVDSYTYIAPPVKKTPAPAKTISTKTASKTTSKKQSPNSTVVAAVAKSSPTSTKVPVASPAPNMLLIYTTSFVALVTLVAAGVLYITSTTPKRSETELEASKFEIE